MAILILDLIFLQEESQKQMAILLVVDTDFKVLFTAELISAQMTRIHQHKSSQVIILLNIQKEMS